MALIEFVRASFSHSSPTEAANYMMDAFGTEKIYEPLGVGISSVFPGSDSVSINVGGVEWQFVNPSDQLPYWQEHFRKYGPSLHHITLYVDEYESYKEKMIARGCKELTQFDLSAKELNYPGALEGDRIEGVVIDAMAQVGLCFVLMKRLSFHDPNILPRKVGKILGFNHFELVHKNPYAFKTFMQEVFEAEQVELFMSEAIEKMGPGAKCVHMLLGGIVFQCYLPTNKPAAWHWFYILHQYGPCVHNTAFYVENLPEIISIMKKNGLRFFQLMVIDQSAKGLKDTPRDAVGYILHGESLEECSQGWEVMENIPLLHKPWEMRVHRR